MCSDLPWKWSDDENIAWRILQRLRTINPVIWGDSIFSTSTLGDFSEQSLIYCHDLSDGSLKWQKSIQSPVKIERSQYVSQAAPSPVVDESGIYAFFENGLLMGFEHDGVQKWKRSLTQEYGPIEGNHGLGSSYVSQKQALVYWLIMTVLPIF